MAFKYNNGQFGAMKNQNPLINSPYSQDYNQEGFAPPPPTPVRMITESGDLMITEVLGDYMILE